MSRDQCPSTEELLSFLDERLSGSLSSDVRTHIDACPHCQQTLDELTRAQVYGLPGLSPNPFTGSTGPCTTIALPSTNDGQESEASGDGIARRVDQRPARRRPNAEGSIAGHADDDPRKQAARAWPRISSYEILEVIREGGMGVVFRARQHGLNRLVALKMIRGGSGARPDQFARFRIEAEAVARLRHPNIVQIYEIGEAEGLPFLSLELLGGGTLEERLAGNPQPGRQAAELLVTIARAIQVAHGAGIVHRDLKPSNVLFTEDGDPKITDFGLAKRLESDSRQTETGQIMGTPCYMAPEQARGHTKGVGPAADVYSLGALLYEMLTGRPPFKGETPMETVRQVVEDEVVVPSRLVPRLARDLETICLKCLKKEPGKRYGSALALAQDLESFLADRPIKAHPTPFWERGIKLARRHPVATTLCTLALAATIGVTAAWMRITSREADRTAALRSEVVQSLLRAQELLTRGLWSDAKPILAGIQAEIRGERDLDDLARRSDELLKQAERIRVNQERIRVDQETRNADLERLRTFRARRRDALFQESIFPEFDLPYDPKTAVASARAALALFAAPGAKEVWTLGALPDSLTSRDHDEIKEGCYELLMIWADGESSPERGLSLLDQAARLRPTTRAYHLHRADCLARKGDAPDAQRERAAANAVSVVSALDHFLLGKELYKREDWAAAIPHFEAALLSQPEHFWSHCLGATCHLQLGHPIQAKSELTSCLQAEPSIAWLYVQRGLASYKVAMLARTAVETLQARGGVLAREIELQLPAAELDYQRALALLDAAPDKDLRYALLINRGMLWIERREWRKAEVDLRAAAQLDDRRWQAFESLAQAYDRQVRPDQAIEEFTRAIKLRPDWAPLYRARSAVNSARKEPTPDQRARAMADIEQAIRLAPPGSGLLALYHTERARLLHREAREEDALAACEAALKVDPNYVDAHRQRLEALRKLKRYGELVRCCDAVLARGKPSSELYELRGLAREKLNDYEGAIEDLTLAIALRPGTMSVLARRGALYLVTDAPRAALRDFQEAIRLDSKNADAYLGRGLAFSALGHYREAVADAAHAAILAEPTRTHLYNAARIHARAWFSASSEARRTGQPAARLVAQYQDETIRLLREWHKHLPANDRASALRALLQDPAMSMLRRYVRALELSGTVSSTETAEPQPRN